VEAAASAIWRQRGAHGYIGKRRPEPAATVAARTSCNSTCRDKDGLRHHVSKVHAKAKIRCSILGCSEYFLNNQDLEAHFRLQHQAQEDLKIFGCTECKYKTSRKSKLNRHLAVNHGREQLNCPKCIKVFKSRLSLQYHLQHAHEKRRSCEFCNGVLADLKRHMVRQQCKRCDFVAPCISLFTMHVKKCTAAAKKM
jgi:uncharacterized C2H2 Zn-finger protein